MKLDWYEQSMRALQLAGKSERTQHCYTRSVRMLVDHYGKAPDLISEHELEEYFLYRKNESKWAPGTMQTCYYGVRFFLRMFSIKNGLSLS